MCFIFFAIILVLAIVSAIVVGPGLLLTHQFGGELWLPYLIVMAVIIICGFIVIRRWWRRRRKMRAERRSAANRFLR